MSGRQESYQVEPRLSNNNFAFKFVDSWIFLEQKNNVVEVSVKIQINQIVWNTFVLALFLLFIFDSYILTIRFCFTSFVKSSSAVCTVNASQSFKLFSPLPPPHLINTWYYSALFSGCHFFCALCLVFCCHKCQTHFHSDSRFERTSLIYDYF